MCSTGNPATTISRHTVRCAFSCKRFENVGSSIRFTNKFAIVLRITSHGIEPISILFVAIKGEVKRRW